MDEQERLYRKYKQKYMLAKQANNTHQLQDGGGLLSALFGGDSPTSSKSLKSKASASRVARSPGPNVTFQGRPVSRRGSADFASSTTSTISTNSSKQKETLEEFEARIGRLRGNNSALNDELEKLTKLKRSYMKRRTSDVTMLTQDGNFDKIAKVNKKYDAIDSRMSKRIQIVQRILDSSDNYEQTREELQDQDETRKFVAEKKREQDEAHKEATRRAEEARKEAERQRELEIQREEEEIRAEAKRVEEERRVEEARQLAKAKREEEDRAEQARLEAERIQKETFDDARQQLIGNIDDFIRKFQKKVEVYTREKGKLEEQNTIFESNLKYFREGLNQNCIPEKIEAFYLFVDGETPQQIDTIKGQFNKKYGDRTDNCPLVYKNNYYTSDIKRRYLTELITVVTAIKDKNTNMREMLTTLIGKCNTAITKLENLKQKLNVYPYTTIISVLEKVFNDNIEDVIKMAKDIGVDINSYNTTKQEEYSNMPDWVDISTITVEQTGGVKVVSGQTVVSRQASPQTDINKLREFLNLYETKQNQVKNLRTELTNSSVKDSDFNISNMERELSTINTNYNNGLRTINRVKDELSSLKERDPNSKLKAELYDVSKKDSRHQQIVNQMEQNEKILADKNRELANVQNSLRNILRQKNSMLARISREERIRESKLEKERDIERIQEFLQTNAGRYNTQKARYSHLTKNKHKN